MMRTTRPYLLLLPLLLAFSCQREEAVLQDDDQLQLAASVEPLSIGTKADIATDTGKFSWTEGDQIAIWFSSASVTRYFDALFTETNAQGKGIFQIGRASCRERVCQYV